MNLGVDRVPQARKDKIRHWTKYWLQPVLTALALHPMIALVVTQLASS